MGDVIFEKIGWGRWSARRHGEPTQERSFHTSSPPFSIVGSFQQRGVEMERRLSEANGRHPYRASVGDFSTAFSYTEDYMLREYDDVDMLEHEADKMSLDGDDGREYCSSSEVPDDLPDEELEGDDTDEEDWAQIGADALRARSLNGSGGFIRSSNVAARAKPLPLGFLGADAGPTASTAPKPGPRNIGIQERAAVEALLRLGSM